MPQRYVDRGTGDFVIGRNPLARRGEWQDLVAQLDNMDWTIRFKAVEEIGRRSRRGGPGARLAHEALKKLLIFERDFKVRDRAQHLLGISEHLAPPAAAPDAEYVEGRHEEEVKKKLPT